MKEDAAQSRQIPSILALVAVFLCFVLITYATEWKGSNGAAAGSEVEPGVFQLPPPVNSRSLSLDEALAARRSSRTFGARPLTLAELGALLWAAQGVTSPEGFRTAPSAGALYPLELLTVIGTDQPLPAGVYQYRPANHSLARIKDGDVRHDLQQAALGQGPVAHAPVVIAVCGVVSRTAAKYGERAERYVWIEAGHATQNLLLEVTALSLAATPIGAFDDGPVKAALAIDAEPIYLIPVGAGK